MKKVLFVCRGNVGRSQMAAALLKKMIPEATVLSAGTKVVGKDGTSRHGQILKDLPAAENTIFVINEAGEDISNAVRAQLTEEILGQGFDTVVVMSEKEHIPEWLSQHPGFVYWEIQDPKGQDVEFHRSIRDQIKLLIEQNRGVV